MNKLENNSEEAAWYVVRTATKRENVASQILRKCEGVEIMCPRIRYKKATKRGTIWWVEAMFPGYFFAKFVFSEHSRLVASSQGVIGLVKFNQNVPAVPDYVIEALKEQMAEGEEGPETMVLQPDVAEGDEVEVASGPFAGEKGIVSRVLDGTQRVGLLLEFLGEVKEVEFDLFALLLGRPQLKNEP